MTDPQFSLSVDAEWQSKNAISKLINETAPDLIIITGDVCDAALDNGVLYQDIIDFLDTFKTPYAITFGNHDGEGPFSKEQLAEIIKSGEYSVYEDGPENVYGVSNYIINVENPKGGIYWSLFMIDSNDYLPEYLPEHRYDYIHEDQIQWYRDSVNTLKTENGGKLNSLAFFHIPFKEYEDAWEHKDDEGVIYHYGEKRESVSDSEIDSGFFDVIKEVGSTKGVFVGHDHLNDYSITYQGIRLTYGLKTAYGSYGDDDIQGGTIITLTEDDFTVEEYFCK